MQNNIWALAQLVNCKSCISEISTTEARGKESNKLLIFIFTHFHTEYLPGVTRMWVCGLSNIYTWERWESKYPFLRKPRSLAPEGRICILRCWLLKYFSRCSSPACKSSTPPGASIHTAMENCVPSCLRWPQAAFGLAELWSGSSWFRWIQYMAFARQGLFSNP